MALNVFFGEASTDGIIALLTITSPGLPPLRVSSDNVPTVSRGLTFEPYPFSISMPLDSASERPSAQLEIANVSPEIMREIRRLLEPPAVKIELVLIKTPNTVEKTIDFLRMVNVSYDALAISASLEPVDLWSQPAVQQVYTPLEFPGLRGVA